MSDATILPVQRTEETSMSIWLTRMIPWPTALLVPMVLAVCPQFCTAADDAAKSFLPADYKGTPFTDEKMKETQKIPGKVYLAYYDKGGEGVAYHDNTKENSGSGGLNKGGKDYVDLFRRDESVDTSYTKEFADQWEGQKAFPEMKLMYVGWTEPGEWVIVTVEVTETATYAVDFMYTSNRGGTVSVDIDGKKNARRLEVESTADPKDTTGWRQWHHWNLARNIMETRLEKGKHLITFKVEEQGNMNLMYLDFKKKE
jgi:hypothetical protein